MESVVSDAYASSSLRRYQALLAMADLLAHSGDLNQLFTELVARLKGVASFDQVSFSLFDATRNIMRLHVWEGACGPPSQLQELPVTESIAGWTWEHQQSGGLSGHFAGDALPRYHRQVARSERTRFLRLAANFGAAPLGRHWIRQRLSRDLFR